MKGNGHGVESIAITVVGILITLLKANPVLAVMEVPETLTVFFGSLCRCNRGRRRLLLYDEKQNRPIRCRSVHSRIHPEALKKDSWAHDTPVT